ncbi:hypothetical protein K227x_26810 [Rubripirellula lacrimiformis]|uniref:Uncharacterized protein n=1 Tax=Rubripirellula lacrimiformis TaxID=1930273 RepID=A0A517NAZ0_9BACT|nr:hypothetical protein [Rubripirellula lacrimiformis]QDT04291.1 hypothetical protein K227x_26810 [Rubripirellula lacrimiformis]
MSHRKRSYDSRPIALSADPDHGGAVARVLSMDADSTTERSRGTMVLAVLIAFVAAMICSTRVIGQEAPAQGKFEHFPLHQALQNPAMVKNVESKTKSYASTGNGDTRMVKAYFTLLVPARLTAADAPKDMNEIVSDVSTYIARAARSNRPEVTQTITQNAYAGLSRVAQGNYPPPGRIAAILMLGRLDQRPANSAAKTPPIPYLAALPTLVKLYTDENNIDGVRAAALQGIHRQVSYGFPGIPQDTRTEISAAMTALLDSEPPMTRTDDVHAYLQRYAVDILTSLRAADDKALGVKLIGISTKADTPDLLALHSAARVGDLGATMQGKVDTPDTVLQSWAARAMRAFESEVDRLNALERIPNAASQPKKPADFLRKPSENTGRGAAGGYGMGGMDGMDEMSGMEDMMMDSSMGSMEDMMMDGGMSGMDEMSMYGMGGGMMAAQAKPQPPEVISSRRRLNHVLQQLHLGVTGNGSAGMPSRNPGGLLVSVPNEKKKLVEDWLTSMKEVVDALNDDMLDDRDKYIEGLESQIEMLKVIVGDQEPERAIFTDDDDLANAPAAAEPEAAAPAAAVGFKLDE